MFFDCYISKTAPIIWLSKVKLLQYIIQYTVTTWTIDYTHNSVYLIYVWMIDGG